MYYLSKLRTQVVDEKGKDKKVKFEALVSAHHILEAEYKIQESADGEPEIVTYNTGESDISKVIRLPKVDFNDGNDDFELNIFHKVKVAYISVDEESGKEKKTKEFILVESEDTKQADSITRDYMKDCVSDWELVSINPSKIIQVIE